MNCKRRKYGFTLVELLVTLTVILILIGGTLRLGQHVRQQSSVQLTASALAVIDTALQQYYDDYRAFPFESLDNNGNDRPDDYTVSHLESDISVANGGVAVNVGGNLAELDGQGNTIDGASGAALFYFLDRHANSRSIIAAIAHTFITSRDADGTLLSMVIDGQPHDLVRFVDPWGTSLWYRYEDGWAFPQVISAGPDRVFNTPDDITSN